MSEIEERLVPTVKRLVKLTKLDLKIKSLKFFKIEPQDYFGELHKPITKIDEFEPKSEIFVEIVVDHKQIGKCRLVIKGIVDNNGNIDFVYSEMPTIPTSPEDMKKDKTLKKRMLEYVKKYQSYLATLLNALINIAMAILKRA